jgi:hypothetical protein
VNTWSVVRYVDKLRTFVFAEETYESAVNDTVEDFFPEVTVDADSTVIVGVKFVSTFVDWGGSVPWFQILGKMPELRMMVKSFSIAYWNLWSVYFIISFRLPSTPQAFLGWRVCILSCSSFKVIGESSGFR